jgi:hypothetical protein
VAAIVVVALIVAVAIAVMVAVITVMTVGPSAVVKAWRLLL